jgi:hypothetical protein
VSTTVVTDPSLPDSSLAVVITPLGEGEKFAPAVLITSEYSAPEGQEPSVKILVAAGGGIPSDPKFVAEYLQSVAQAIEESALEVAEDAVCPVHGVDHSVDPAPPLRVVE